MSAKTVATMRFQGGEVKIALDGPTVVLKSAAWRAEFSQLQADTFVRALAGALGYTVTEGR